MPETLVYPQFNVTLTAPEMRLVTMGLAGMLKDAADVEAARKLNEHLCAQRVHQLKMVTEVSEKALINAKKLTPPNDGVK